MSRAALMIVAGVWLALAGTAVAQTEPPELYLQCYFQIQEADKLKNEGRIVEAFDKYRDALQRLEGISKQYPDWRQDLVKYRTRYCSDEIARLKTEADAKRGESGPTSPAPQPAPVRRPAEREEMLPTEETPARTPARMPVPATPSPTPSPSPMATLPVPIPVPPPSPSPVVETVPEPQAPAPMPPRAVARTQARPQVPTPLPAVELPAGARESAAPPAETGELKRRVDDLAGQLERTQSDLNRTKAELSQTQEQLKAAVAERDGLRVRLEKTEADLKAAKEDTRIAALMQENADLKSRLQEADRQIATLKSADAQNVLKTLQGQLEGTKEQLARAQEENRMYEQTTKQLRQQLEGLQAKLAESEARVKTAGTAPEAARVLEENEVLRAVVDRQLKEQARREAAKKLAIDELKNLEIQSDVLAKQIEILATPLVELSANEISMLRLTVPPAGAEGAVIAEPLDGSTPVPEKPKGPADSVPPDVAPVAKSARMFFDQGKYEDAGRLYQQILTRYPDNLYALSNLGVVRFQQGKFREAEEVLLRSIKAAPNDGFSHSILGIVYYMTARFDEAVSTLTRAATLEPGDPQTHNYLGIACSRKGWQQVAEQEVRKAIELNPNYGDAHFNLAVIYATQNPPAKEMARRHYKSAVQLGLPPDPELEKLLE